MTDDELLDLNARGFIPGPGESEEQFTTRVAAARLASLEGEALPRAHWEWVSLHLKELFHFKPESLSAVYSNQKLAPWQGAACWIGEDRVPLLQLREGFRKGSYLRLYSRGEILAHEAVHAARAAFDEMKYEEFFAYSTSGQKWRRIFGPILQRTWEPWLFFATLCLGLFSEIGWILSACLMAAGFWRLIRRHLQLSKAFNSLRGRLKNTERARAVLFRLTDREIWALSKGMWLEGDETLRWRLIRLAYFR
jgi:hypothetical protein